MGSSLFPWSGDETWKKNQELRNSGKETKEVGFQPPWTADCREARLSLYGSKARRGEESGSECGKQPSSIQGSEKERDHMDIGYGTGLEPAGRVRDAGRIISSSLLERLSLMGFQFLPERVQASSAPISSSGGDFYLSALPDFLSS